jgi:hypothetical protein
MGFPVLYTRRRTRRRRFPGVIGRMYNYAEGQCTLTKKLQALSAFVASDGSTVRAITFRGPWSWIELTRIALSEDLLFSEFRAYCNTYDCS